MIENCRWNTVKSGLIKGGKACKFFENLYVIDVDTDGCYVDICIIIHRHGTRELMSFGAFIPSMLFKIQSDDDALELLSNQRFVNEFEDEFEEYWRDWEFGTIEV